MRFLQYTDRALRFREAIRSEVIIESGVLDIMDRKIFRGFVAGLFVSFVASTFVIWLMIRDRKLNVPYGQNVINVKLEEIQDCIDSLYIGDVDTDKLYTGAYEGYVSGLGDKYSGYLSYEDNLKAKEHPEESVFGIGAYIAFDEESSRPYLSHVIEGSTAYRAGMQDGDILISIDDRDTFTMSLDTIKLALEGEINSWVKLGVKRKGEVNILEYEIQRRKVNSITVDYEMLEGDIGYIKVSAFEYGTISQFDLAVDSLTDENMKGLIIDLRDNIGGLTNAAVDMCDRLLPAGKLVTYMIDKKGNKEEMSTSNDEMVSVPIVVLINRNSASSSEVVTGCLLDYDMAVTIGERSFGKGVSQKLIPLGDGDALKITYARFYSPNGTNIHEQGFEPDIPAEDDPETEEDEVIQAALEYFDSIS